MIICPFSAMLKSWASWHPFHEFPAASVVCEVHLKKKIITIVINEKVTGNFQMRVKLLSNALVH